ncbi:MAG: siroheme synthase CysG [Kiloniellales bacterium]|nr:siroheme synthase CysG [Kiloniellales bacterium]
MKSLPIFLDLKGRTALLVGGAAAALPKARLLQAAGAELRIVALDPDEDLRSWAAAQGIALAERSFQERDLDGARIVIAAASDDEIRAAVEAATARRIPVNVVDRPELSSFLMPAIVDRDDVVVAISTHGSAPVLARRLRRTLEALLPARLGPLAAFARRYRGALAAAVTDPSARRRFWEAFFDGPVARDILAGDDAKAGARMLAEINAPGWRRAPRGRVALVGAGPGDPELLTLKALRLLQDAEVVVYDKLVGPEILDYARRDAERIYVGKAPGRHSHGQAEINEILLREARAGKRVVRLKGGDPFVFGRGGEELERLLRHGVEVELVPGITAATGCAAVAGIPLTHRDHASAVTFVSGQGKDGAPELDWAALASRRHTLAVYMGVAGSAGLSRELIAQGRDPETPVAVIERGSLPGERKVFGTLRGLGALIAREKIQAPALIVIGEVVRLAAAAPQGSGDALPLAAAE